MHDFFKPHHTLISNIWHHSILSSIQVQPRVSHDTTEFWLLWPHEPSRSSASCLQWRLVRMKSLVSPPRQV